jgi:LysR family transcriptional regulator for metE and metH
MRHFPEVQVQIVPEAARRTMRALEAEEIEVAIATEVHESPGVVVEELFTDEMVAIMAPSHELAHRHHLEALDFADQHVVAHPDSASGFLFAKLLNPSGITPTRVSEFPLTEAVVETVKAGLGISVVPRWAVAPDLAAGTLRALRLTEGGLCPTWSAVMRENIATSDALIELVYHLRCCALG